MHLYCVKKIILIFLTINSFRAASQLSFTSLDSLLQYASAKSVSTRISEQQTLLAKWTKIAAIGNSVNFRNPLSFSANNNLQLPVNFIPAEAFGGPAGSYRQITLGQQYVSNFNFNPQIDIINPGNLAKIKSASVSKELTEVNNQLVRKSLSESIAAAWSNVVALQEQEIITVQSLASADSITQICRNKEQAGTGRRQDLNNALANGLAVADKLNQVRTGIQQQINAIKILCDIPSSTTVEIKPQPTNGFGVTAKPTGRLQSMALSLQSELAIAELKSVRGSMLPVVSLQYYEGWQKNSNTGFFDANAAWIHNRFLGLRITMPFPPEVSRLSQSYNNKVSGRISALNSIHGQLQEEISNESLQLEYDKSLASFNTGSEIVKLKADNYEKSLAQYEAGILPADFLFIAFNDLLSSKLNMATARAALEYNRQRIIINNQFK